MRYRQQCLFSFALSLAAAVGTLGASTSTPTVSDSDLTGPAILARAIAIWSAQPQAAYLSYDVSAKVTRKGRTREQREHVLFRSSDRTAVVRTPDGKLTFGRPQFIPDVAFRLVPRVANSFDSPFATEASPDPLVTPLATIVTMVVPLRRYDVVSLGRETYDGQSVYHLKLMPRFKPEINSVRDMWVDTRTFVTWGLIDEARFAIGPARGTFLLRATYAPVRDAWLLRRVTTSGALRFGFIAVGGDAEVTFANIEAPSHAPQAYCFERTGVADHKAECDEILAPHE